MPQSAKSFFTSLVVCGLLSGSPCWLYGMEGPDSVDLASLVNLYGAVTFDHVMHAEATSCAACHHHTTGDAVEDENCLPCHANSAPTDEVACASCHPGGKENAELQPDTFKGGQAYHFERTGLKRAYHVKCLGCHRETGAVSGCGDCHQKLEAGKGLDRQEQEK